MKTIFFNRVFGKHQAFCLGVATFVSIWGLWLVYPPSVVASDPAWFPEAKITLIESEKRWIEVNLLKQRLLAWEGNKLIEMTPISSGKTSTPTYSGIFKVETKRLHDRMRGIDYDISNVPYTMYYDRGYAIHGAPWHNRFGTPISHGCINLPVDAAKWLFNWTNVGTPILIH
jgi:lipoprotein-anchoring transpeptidase ErfK/SrfK